MQDLLLGIIAISLVVLTIELTVVFYFIIVFLKEVVILTRRIKTLEASWEEKMEKFQTGLTILGINIFKKIIGGIGKSKKK